MKMIRSEECMDLILKKFPGFKAAWQEHLNWWGGDISGLSNDMSAFSDYALSLLKSNKHDQEIKHIFIFIEQLVADGDQAVRDAAATCFLENLINATSWGRISASSFAHLLGTKSKNYCKAWDEFTGVKTEGLWPKN
jgi:hypothetical protein